MLKRISVAATVCLLFSGGQVMAQDILIWHWWGPGPEQFRTEVFDGIAAAGFNTALVEGSTIEEIRQGLDLCKNSRIKGMISLQGLYNKDNYQDYTQLIECVQAVKNHPALWGYRLWDEPMAADAIETWLAGSAAAVREADGAHPVFTNLLPSFAWKPYEENVEHYIQTNKPDLLSYDRYVLFKDREDTDGYFDNIESIRKLALKYNIPFNNIFLSIPHFDYRDPSEADLRWQVFTSLAYGAKGLAYFTYMTPPPGSKDFEGWGEALVHWDGTPTSKYYYAKRINAEVNKLAPILGQLKSTAVYHTAPVPPAATALPDNNGPVAWIEGGEFVVGCFESDKGKKYAMFVNRNLHTACEAQIAFTQKKHMRVINSATGRPERMKMKRLAASEADAADDVYVWEAHLEPGQGKLVLLGR